MFFVFWHGFVFVCCFRGLVYGCGFGFKVWFGVWLVFRVSVFIFGIVFWFLFLFLLFACDGLWGVLGKSRRQWTTAILFLDYE